MARGSALECVAILDLLAVNSRRAMQVAEARQILVRVVQTTTGLWRKHAR